MKKRKTIAVVVTGYDWEYETRVIDGIYHTCKEKDINVLVFATLVRKPPLNIDKVLDEDVVKGETEIFNLMNCDMIDGILILGDNLVKEECVFEIAEKAKEKNVPVININDTLRIIDHNILVDNKEAMEHVVRHIIKEHGLTKINFIGGFPGNIQTEERLAAYKRVLKEFDIPFEEERVLYGEFWVKATECTREFLSREELPQAIVCASDTMALFAIDCIKEHGLRVPEDIIVTGFDGIADCETAKTTLTTVRPAYRKLGIEGVLSLEKMWNGENVPQILNVESELILHESCGCEKKELEGESYYNTKYDIYNTFKLFNSMLIDMNTLFSEANSSEKLYKSVGESASFFGFKKLFICVCDAVENASADFEKLGINDLKYGLTDNLITMYSQNNEVPVRTKFKKKDMLPIDFLNDKEPVFMAFSSLYFKGSYIGYIAYEPSKTHGYSGVLFLTWVLNIGNHAGTFYMKRELKATVKQLENLYDKDPLTGLFNRRGMTRNKSLVDEAIKEAAYITVIACDVDNLKMVNDNYGHEAGDVVITEVAKALKSNMPEGSVCVRTGGDEFVAFMKHSSYINMEGLMNDIDKYLDDFNTESGLPYKALCSCGYYTKKMDDKSDFDEMCNIADDKMYEKKKIKKTNRL